ncbi:hypothetical protein [Pectobacterium sp. B1J-3]
MAKNDGFESGAGDNAIHLLQLLSVNIDGFVGHHLKIGVACASPPP